ncbi:hypothetical protein BGL48_11945 [Salinivibrio sp. SS3]|uniref:Uncharacterized protein n=1 Tax=Salinivibrio phage SMHB1 TaxID=1897436 RepID=A0A1D9C9S4_9CAUD|nr:hypothetical protein [Salinivibrio sp. BNH]YP_009786966.1 hypothetical protein HOR26_gp24 [Salinivibrio phage SMHB1]AOY11829.1 hypothetical protein [Salinivibrio phage SMHB1]ODP98286.1 hypothetical protein BGL48_11945 [Salinivibrio sp. BNH]
MNYTLLTHNELNLLFDAGADSSAVIAHIDEIETLAVEVNNFYENLLSASNEKAAELEAKRQALLKKIGVNIIGVPFTNHDATLYALDRKLNFTRIEINAQNKES